jgi:hypothetical protein
MAEWRNLARTLLLADGQIDEAEAQILRDELFEDGKIDDEERDFLNDLRNSAKSCAPAFTELFVDAVKNNLLADGVIDDNEARWLRKAIFADGKVDKAEIRLMMDLKSGAKKVSKEFEILYKECVPG